ncbi:hypothetical protein AAG906_012035 [Vitis piasezkii]
MRLRRVIWNPWKSNGKLRNMKNRSFEVLCHKQIRNARRGIMSATFGALPGVQFMHAISFLYSVVEFLLKLPDICDTLEAELRKLKANFAALRSEPFAAKRHPLVISCELLTGNPRLKITLNGAPAGHESADTPIGHESYAIQTTSIIQRFESSWLLMFSIPKGLQEKQIFTKDIAMCLHWI